MAKFEKGRHCLVLAAYAVPHMVGKEVVLDSFVAEVPSVNGKKIYYSCWSTTPPVFSKTGRRIIFEQVTLMPIDDPDINRDLLEEMVDRRDPVVIRLEKLGKELEELERLMLEWHEAMKVNQI